MPSVNPQSVVGTLGKLALSHSEKALPLYHKIKVG